MANHLHNFIILQFVLQTDTIEKKQHAHGSEVGVVKEAPLSEDGVVAEGAVVMAVVGHHET